jgi:heptosyltransferase-2
VHLAAAFDVKVVAIFGPTVKKWGFFPLSSEAVVVERAGLSCRPCSLHGPNSCPKKHFKCMDEITVEEVFSAVQNLID